MKFGLLILGIVALFAGEVKAQSVVQFTFGPPPHRDSLAALQQNLFALGGLAVVRLDLNSRQGYLESAQNAVPDENQIRNAISNAGMLPGCYVQYERGTQERALLDHRACIQMQQAEEAK